MVVCLWGLFSRMSRFLWYSYMCLGMNWDWDCLLELKDVSRSRLRYDIMIVRGTGGVCLHDLMRCVLH